MLSAADEACFSAAAAAVPLLASLSREQLSVARLGGLTNIVFRVEARVAGGLQRYCLRCPGPGTESYIDRAAERANAEAACRAGVGPAVLSFSDGGVLLMPLLPGETMSPEAFRSRPGAAARAGVALRTLHHSGEAFASRFELFEQVDKYLGELGDGASLPEGYGEALADAQAVRAALSARPLPVAPCHCDPLCENFVDDAESGAMRIVDFEYAGMCDPLWDVADLSVEAGLDAAKEAELLRAYFGGATPTQEEVGRVVLYKAMCDLLWTLWGLLQHKNGNPAEDFWAYATGRFVRCQRLMARPDFAQHVAAVRAGQPSG